MATSKGVIQGHCGVAVVDAKLQIIVEAQASWRVSISMETSFCIDAVEEALHRQWNPEIFNTDQGSQFTSEAFTGLLKQHGIAISMDGKGCWRDDVFVEQLRAALPVVRHRLLSLRHVRPLRPQRTQQTPTAFLHNNRREYAK